MRRIAAVIALVFLMAAGCATTTSGAGFAGYKWSVVTIDYAGKETPVPSLYSVFLQFTPSGQFGANDSVNYHSGTYRQTGDGFTTSHVGTTLAGYMGNNPVVLAAQSAIAAFGDGTRATATVTGDRLIVTVAGYMLSCQRDGKQANFPPAQPT
jgi:META domain